MGIGDEIRKRRKAKGLTQVELAKRLHLNGPEITRWERNKVTPDTKSLQAIAAELKCQVSDLIGDQPDPEVELFNSLSPETRKLANVLGAAIDADPQHKAILEECWRILQRGDKESEELAARLLRRL